MKKITNIEVELINLDANDVIATSGVGTLNANYYGGDATLVGGRYNFDNGSYQGETFDNDYDYSSHYE